MHKALSWESEALVTLYLAVPALRGVKDMNRVCRILVVILSRQICAPSDACVEQFSLIS